MTLKARLSAAVDVPEKAAVLRVDTVDGEAGPARPAPAPADTLFVLLVVVLLLVALLLKLWHFEGGAKGRTLSEH